MCEVTAAEVLAGQMTGWHGESSLEDALVAALLAFGGGAPVEIVPSPDKDPGKATIRRSGDA